MTRKNDPIFNHLKEILKKENHVEFLKVKKERNFDINIKDESGNSLLFGASYKNIIFLIEQGIDVNITNKIGENALFYAFKAAEIKKLINAGINVNQLDFNNRNCLFMKDGIESLHKENVRLLIKAGLDINHIDNDGRNILFSLMSRPHIFEYCASKGADHTIADKNGRNVKDLIYSESRLDKIFNTLDEVKATRERAEIQKVLSGLDKPTMKSRL